MWKNNVRDAFKFKINFVQKSCLYGYFETVFTFRTSLLYISCMVNQYAQNILRSQCYGTFGHSVYYTTRYEPRIPC